MAKMLKIPAGHKTWCITWYVLADVSWLGTFNVNYGIFSRTVVEVGVPGVVWVGLTCIVGCFFCRSLAKKTCDGFESPHPAAVAAYPSNASPLSEGRQIGRRALENTRGS